jgi:hypothetical protein
MNPLVRTLPFLDFTTDVFDRWAVRSKDGSSNVTGVMAKIQMGVRERIDGLGEIQLTGILTSEEARLMRGWFIDGVCR